MFGRRDRLQPRPRRLDAPVRRETALLRRERHRRRRHARSPSGSRSPTRCRAATRVTACFFGDGAVAEGEFHEAINLAALWQLPVLFCCENNRYAMGTALAREHAETDLALRASSYGMASWPVDGMDVLAVRGRREPGGRGDPWRRRPGLPGAAHLPLPGPLDVRPRPLPRPRRRSRAWRARDPIPAFEARCAPRGSWTTTSWPRLEAEVDAELLARAVESAERAPLEPVEDLTGFVTSPAGTGD